MWTQPHRSLLKGMIAFLIGISCLALIRMGMFAFLPLNSRDRAPVLIEIRKGQSPHETARLLAERKIIKHPQLLLWLGRLTGYWRRAKAGEYEVMPAMSPLEVFSTFSSGVSVVHPLTVREGENLYEIASNMERHGLSQMATFLELCKSASFISNLPHFGTSAPETLEGYLFPDTYFFNRTLTAEDMARQMVRRFFAVWGEAEEQRSKELRLNRHQIITLASIIEKETGAGHERSIISSVFYNRLKRRMRLQSDPTTIYGMWDIYRGNIRKQDLSTRNAYNTYMIPALPAGPISNPGREAIAAALYPANTDFIYFVSKNDGTHVFSRTLAEHAAAVRNFQQNSKARDGKSWRDLQKRK